MRLLIPAVLALVTLVACATSGGRTPEAGCVVPATICHVTAEPSGDAPPTCGHCSAEALFEWSRQTGCDFGGVACAGGGTIYLDDHQYYCCLECPDDCEPAPPGRS